MWCFKVPTLGGMGSYLGNHFTDFTQDEEILAQLKVFDVKKSRACEPNGVSGTRDWGERPYRTGLGTMELSAKRWLHVWGCTFSGEIRRQTVHDTTQAPVAGGITRVRGRAGIRFWGYSPRRIGLTNSKIHKRTLLNSMNARIVKTDNLATCPALNLLMGEIITAQLSLILSCYLRETEAVD